MQVEFYFCKNTYNTHGASPLFSPVANLLTARLNGQEYGAAIAEIDVTANLRSPTREFLPTLETLFDQFHSYIETLPTITFRRSRGRVEIDYLSEHFNRDDDNETAATPENLRVAAAEVADALELLRKRVKPDDDFDIERFLSDATAALMEPPGNRAEWDVIIHEGRAIDQARLEAKSPIERLDVDWAEYHPEARGLLEDPFFWDCVDDFAPHGNDTGADLLELFKSWNRKNRLQSPMTFLKQLTSEWGIEPIDWHDTDQETTRQLDRDDSVALSVCNEAAIALAFAAIKLRAKCPVKVAAIGLAALDRQDTCFSQPAVSEELRSAWLAASELMRAKLL